MDPVVDVCVREPIMDPVVDVCVREPMIGRIWCLPVCPCMGGAWDLSAI